MPEHASNFIRSIVEHDLETGATDGHVVTRFPPEPNGYLHIGHAKSICLNFGLSNDYNGRCHLRFDDTNPTTEDLEFVEAIKRDVNWLGFDWGEHLYFASDYFDRLYAIAVQLVQDGKAYVDSSSEEEIRAYRGSVTEPGRPSPYRDRPVQESLALLEEMKAGQHPDGAHVLRAKIDMASPNMKLRDPLLYRIKRGAHHYRTGGDWHIYPMYDFAHPLSDAIENITHSLCTLEFENNRAIYEWLMEHAWEETPHPHQYEFARLNLDYTVMSKRKLLQLVNEHLVNGWDDPRMPTISGLRRRGVRPAAIRDFADRIGVAKADNRIDVALLEYAIRDDLNTVAPRVMAVLDPLKVTITNWPEGKTENLTAASFPDDVGKPGERTVPFTREVFIERSDFNEDPPKGYYRLTPGGEVRLRHGYVIACDEVVRDASGSVVELRCTYDPATKSGSDTSGRRVKGTIHWVSVEHALDAEVRLYDRLFRVANPDGGEEDFKSHLNPDSLVIVEGAKVEPSVAGDPTDTRYQFTRNGYFWRDSDSTPDRLVFNRIVTLRDSWAKQREAEPEKAPAKRSAPVVTEGPSAEELLAERLDVLDAKARVRYDAYLAEGLDAEVAILFVEDDALAQFFVDGLNAGPVDAVGLANWIANDVRRVLKDRPEAPLTGPAVAELVNLIDAGTVSHRIARDVFARMAESGGSPEAIVEAQGLKQVSDEGALVPVIDALMAEHAGKVAAYRAGKTGLKGFFIGQVMRQTGGKANPQLVQRLVGEKLAG